MDEVRLRKWSKIGRGGGLVIPAAMRKALGLKVGDAVQLQLAEEEVRVVSRDTVIRRVQERVAKYVPEGVSLVDDLIEERIREAAIEERIREAAIEEQDLHGGDLDHWIEVIRKRRGLS